MRVIRTVSLCLKTAEIASDMDNFSAFVRTALAHHGGQEDSLHTMEPAKRKNGGYCVIHTHIYENPWTKVWKEYRISIPTNKCDPFHKKRQCMVCWPVENGPIETQLNPIWETALMDEMKKEAGQEEE